MLPTTRTLFTLLREINLKSIQQSAHLPVRLALFGDPDLAADLARTLGGTPWVSVLAAAADARPGDVLLRVSRHAPPDELLPKGALEVVVEAEARQPDQIQLPELGPTPVSGELAAAILDKTPETLRLSLARHVPPLRDAYARTLIEDTSRGNAVYAASTGLAEVVPVLNIPLNMADLVILSKNQLIMAYKLALAEGKKGEPQELMKEIISVVGGGFFFRQVARELIGLIPAWGIIPKVAVAYAGTWVIGQTVHAWAAEGETATVREMRRYYTEALDKGKALAESVVAGVRSSGKRPWRNKAKTPKRLSAPQSPGADAESDRDSSTP